MVTSNTAHKQPSTSDGVSASACAFQRLIASVVTVHTNSMRMCRTSAICVEVCERSSVCVCVCWCVGVLERSLVVHNSYERNTCMIVNSALCIYMRYLVWWMLLSCVFHACSMITVFILKPKCVSLLKFLHLSSVWLSKSRCERHKVSEKQRLSLDNRRRQHLCLYDDNTTTKTTTVIVRQFMVTTKPTTTTTKTTAIAVNY